ncbi:alpha/beta fold hydrolase [Uliginosibacterium sp. 31-16]|uniref:PHA/PHB synthase family protein n=1 Tax=Uliginosibacterium sp. 31-16 TaxID=3068315 RepID=UPI00273E719F|nr:alpha/beta fold hydrolase [Uliginosibacterium sp. 31-16]MDP5240123.1 alpha/beta fold hydrolase [Uliginosibacterium sp. 31-16]
MNAKQGDDDLKPERPFYREWHEKIDASVDPLGVFVPLAHAQLAWLLHPQELIEHVMGFSSDVLAVAVHAARRAAGVASEDPITPQPDDNRFSDPAWTEHASWDITKEWYLLVTRRIQDMLYETPGLSDNERRRAAFWWRTYLNAVAPTNFFWSNPAAMRLAVETRGESLRAGWQNFVDDLAADDLRMTNPDDFKVGENLATTPGVVVARNRLLEVLRYAPTKSKVHSRPIVIVTPWINKFYILDLTPKKSMVRYLLDQGFDVYITSWKNPDASMRDVSFEDYLIEGVDFAINTARTLSKSDQVVAAGYCIGGTALSIYMAWAARQFPADKHPVACWTLFTTLTDFSAPGDIEVFIDEGSVRYLTDAMRRKGVLEGKEMAVSFRLLRSNGLIWHYYVHGYLYGEKPSAFDVLFWNMDSTRMPAAMHSWYLKELYLHNRLIERDALTVAGQPIDLERIEQPLYAVGAEDDHIAPWRQTFRVMNFVRGPKRYVLSSSGHILGIVNPVVTPPKRKFRADVVHRTDTVEKWLARADWTSGSWWEDWMAWLVPQAGELREAPAVEKLAPRKLGAAPGTYVLEP